MDSFGVQTATSVHRPSPRSSRVGYLESINTKSKRESDSKLSQAGEEHNNLQGQGRIKAGYILLERTLKKVQPHRFHVIRVFLCYYSSGLSPTFFFLELNKIFYFLPTFTQCAHAGTNPGLY